MMMIADYEDAPAGPKLKFGSDTGLAYQTFATPSRYEPASLGSELADTILNALGRDDNLRREYVRRRWQGCS
jgi:hypothetical protein